MSEGLSQGEQPAQLQKLPIENHLPQPSQPIEPRGQTQLQHETLESMDRGEIGKGIDKPQTNPMGITESDGKIDRFTPQEAAVISSIARELEVASASINESARQQELTLGELADTYGHAVDEVSKVSVPEEVDEFQFRLQQLPIVYGRLRNDFYKKTNGLIENDRTIPLPEPYPSEPSDDYLAISIDDLETQVFVGQIAFVEYTNRKTKEIQTVVGRVQFNKKSEIEIFNEHTRNTTVLYEFAPTIRSINVEPDSTEWQRCRKSDILTSMQGKDNMYGVIKTKSFLVAGKIELDTRYPNNHIVQVTDLRGTQHHLDLDYFEGDVLLTENSEKTSHWQIGIVDEPLNNIDIWKEERLQLIDGLIQDGTNIYENQKLYQFLSEHLDYTKTLLLKTYPQRANELISSTIRELGEAYLPLLFDPGIALRSKQFNTFVQSYLNTTPNASLDMVREAFSEHLGKQKVYRGVKLTEPEMMASRKNGLDSLGYKDKTFFKSLLTQHLDPFYREKPPTSRNLFEELSKRVSIVRTAQPNATLSVTNYPEIAHSVATPKHQGFGTVEGDVYVYDMEIPKIALISKEGIFSSLNHENVLKIGTREFDESVDTGIELFVPLLINPSWIKTVEKMDIDTDKWEFIVE